VVALPKSSALGQSTKSLRRNTLFRRTRAELFGLHRDIAAATGMKKEDESKLFVDGANVQLTGVSGPMDEKQS